VPDLVAAAGMLWLSGLISGGALVWLLKSKG
jgi:hypothetical protein